MSQHPNARLAPKGRETLVSRIEGGLGIGEGACQMGVGRQTAARWLRRARRGESMDGRAWESEAGRAEALPAYLKRYDRGRPHSAAEAGRPCRA